MDEKKYSVVTAQLSALQGKLKEKLAERSRLLKVAEKQEWDRKSVARAQAVWDEAQEIHRQISDVLESGEGLLREEGLDPDLIERELASHLDKEPRWWKRDLTPAVINPTGASIEECLTVGLDTLLRHVPETWWKDQSALCDEITDSHFLSPLVLYGWHDCRPLPKNIHQYAYALRLAEIYLRGGGFYDVYNGAALVPVIAGLCRHFDAIMTVKNGIAKLEELPTAASEETESRVYEILVAARMAELGRSVELLQSHVTKSPDIRIHDLTFPAVAECKRQSRLSAYEREEVVCITELFSILVAERVKRGLVGELILDLHVPAHSVSPKTIAEVILKHRYRIDPRFEESCEWGTVSFRPMEPSRTLPGPSRLYGPVFLNHVFGWPGENLEFDGICAVVANAECAKVGKAELPFCLKWRQGDPQCIDRKARSIVSLLKEAWEQIPTGEVGFIYLAFEDSHRPSVADRKTKRIMELADILYFKQRHAVPMRIVVNRVYPQPIDDGEPDLIESSMPMSVEPEDALSSFLPTCIYTSD